MIIFDRAANIYSNEAVYNTHFLISSQFCVISQNLGVYVWYYTILG